MHNNFFEEALKNITTQKSEFIQRLVSFVCGDTILYLPENEAAIQSINEINNLLKTQLTICKTITTSPNNTAQEQSLFNYLSHCSSEKLTLIYLLATEIRSVILAILFAEKKLSSEQTFNIAFAEELSEQKKWGTLPEITLRQTMIKEKLSYLEKIRNERNIH